MTRSEAHLLAWTFIRGLNLPNDVRCLIAGSFRRQCQEVGDIDLVIERGDWEVPTEPYPGPLSGELMEAKPVGAYRVAQSVTVGDHKIDIFVEGKKYWGGMVAFATGPREYNRFIEAVHGNREVWFQTEAYSERAFFDAIKQPFFEPRDRVAFCVFCVDVIRGDCAEFLFPGGSSCCSKSCLDAALVRRATKAMQPSPDFPTIPPF